MKIEGNGDTREVRIDGELLDPKPSQRFRNHSPDGFNWGYGGSGPAQLALAIMLRVYGLEDTNPKRLVWYPFDYQALKWQILANLAMGEDFTIEISEADLRERFGRDDEAIHAID